MLVGDRIKEIRKEKHLTQKELGEKLGVSYQMIAQYENGKRVPKFETIIKIADALEVDIYDLLNIEANKEFIKPKNSLVSLFAGQPKAFETIETNDDKFIKIANNYHKLNKEGREKALEQVEMLTKIPEYRRDQTEE